MVATEASVSDVKEELINLYRKKEKFMVKILEITENANFTGTDQDVQAYTVLIERRENIINEIKNIDHKLFSQKYKEILADRDISREVERMKSSIFEIVKKVIDLDKKIDTIIESVYHELKHKIKDIAVGKNVNNAYQSAGVGDEAGHHFDTQK